MNIQLHCKHFSELNIVELYNIFKARMEVFAVEQNIVYQDADDKDLESYHLWYTIENEIVAYCRLLPKGISYNKYCSIGRVLTTKNVRGKNLGRQLMLDALTQIEKLWPNTTIKISAQAYLEKFYTELGFKTVTEPYIEEDIWHVGMVR